KENKNREKAAISENSDSEQRVNNTRGTAAQQTNTAERDQAIDFLEVISTLQTIIAGDKMSNQKKNIITDELKKLLTIIVDLKTKITVLESENWVLREVQSSNTKSYAQTVQMPSTSGKPAGNQRRQDPRHIAFISAEGNGAKEIQKLVTETVKPARDRIRIRSLRTIDKLHIVETDSEEDIEKLQNLRTLKVVVKVEKPRKRKPLMIIYDVNSTIKEDELMEIIYEQNFAEIMALDIFKKTSSTDSRVDQKIRALYTTLWK
ncbi:hypothetical protein L9F63_019478, partial [Diploptera punctata]